MPPDKGKENEASRNAKRKRNDVAKRLKDDKNKHFIYVKCSFKTFLPFSVKFNDIPLRDIIGGFVDKFARIQRVTRFSDLRMPREWYELA